METEMVSEQGLPKVTAKTTRAQLVEAYHKALEIIRRSPAERSTETKVAKEKQVVEKASGLTAETIIKRIAEVQVVIGKSLNDLSEKLTAESNALGEIREAVAIETTRLKELHDIDVQAGALAALIEAQEEQKQSWEKDIEQQRKSIEDEMQSKREVWRREQQQHENDVKERDAIIKKQRERDEEEYKYRLTADRRKDTDEQAVKKQQVAQDLASLRQQTEKELADRKAAMVAQEHEIAELRKRVEEFPAELEEGVKKAEMAVRSALKQQFEFDAKLAAKESDAERKLHALKVANLEEIISKQHAQIVDLTKQLQTATKQVQEMAVRAFESAAGFKVRSGSGESSGEVQKSSAT